MSSSVTQYRKRLKTQNPEKYAQYLLKQRVRAKERRDELRKELNKRKPNKTALEEWEKRKAQGRERQKKYIEKKRSNAEQEDQKFRLTVKISGNKTRHSIEKQRLYWRNAKQKERARMSRQKRVAIREKDRLRKQKNKHDKGNTAKLMMHVGNVNQRNKEKKKTTRHEHFAFLKKWKSREVKSALKIVAQKLLKSASMRSVARQTGLSRSTVARVKVGLPRKKSTRTEEHKRLVKKFYCREDISRVLPQKRYAMKSGAGYLLQVSLKAAYSQFMKENPGIKISFSKFASLRPPHVRLLKNTYREFCLCVYCINIRYKLLVTSRLCADRNKKLTSERDLIAAVLCPKSDGARFHNPACIQGTCTKCCDMESSLRDYFNYLTPIQKVTWNHWTRVEENNKKRRILETKTDNGESLLKELIDDFIRPCLGTNFVQHIFVADWQLMQYNHLKSNIAESSVMTVMDIAKNRTIYYQDEIKSAYFGAKQVTIHPIVAHYNKEGTIIRDSLIFISDDIQHDYHAVQHFKHLADEHIEQALGTKPLRKYIFSDGCSSQYKSKGPICDLSLMTEETNRNYFGSEHGKCESDGETGILNRALDRAILSRKVVINNSKDMFNYCVQNLALDEPLTKRHFFYVTSAEINRNRPFTDVKTLPQTRKIHQMCNIVGKPYKIKVRNLSCFCGHCSGLGDTQCINKAYIQAFSYRTLKRVTTTVTVEDEEAKATSDVDLVDAAIESLVEADSNELLPGMPGVEMADGLFAEVCGSGDSSQMSAVGDSSALVGDPGSGDSNALLEQNSGLKPSTFVQVKCTSEHNRVFFYVAQVTNVPEEDGSGLTVTYLKQPYKQKPNIWAWGETQEHFFIDRNQVTKVLTEPEIIANRTGSLYFNFQELMIH